MGKKQNTSHVEQNLQFCSTVCRHFKYLRTWCILFFSVILYLSVCTSCRVYRYETPPPRYATRVYSTRELSNRLGIQVTTRDNHELYNTVAQWLGTPYRRGQSSIRGTDCSGFVMNVYRSVYGKNLSRSSADMLRINCKSIPRQSLREGDLVFFSTNRNSRRVTHVGIYLKNSMFVHSSTSRGVIISNLDEPYYRQRWISGGVVR